MPTRRYAKRVKKIKSLGSKINSLVRRTRKSSPSARASMKNYRRK